MNILTIILIVIAIQYTINFVLAYIALPKQSNVTDWWCELQQFHWVVWFPFFGLLLQIILIITETIKALLRSIKKLRIK